MEASCGPSNALQNLSKHSQRDNSLQHEFSRGAVPQAAQFKQSQAIDRNLNQDFQSFNSNDFANSFMNQFNPQQFKAQVNQLSVQQNHLRDQFLQQNQNLQFQQQNVQSGQQHNQAWINDFSSMSLNQTQNVPHQMNHGPQFSQYNQFYQPGMALRNATPMMPQAQHMTEHKEIHKFEQSIDDQFALIEQELNAQEEQGDVEKSGHDHDQFAKTAREIETTMKKAASENNELGEKFQNSDFLKLMQSISTRNVELEGDKLVDSKTKQDIREKPQDSEPVQPIVSPTINEPLPTYHHPPFDSAQPPMPPQPQEQQPEHENKLADPLAHVADGALSDINDPLMMAQIISGGQVKRKDWLNADTDWLDSPRATKPQPRVRRSILTEHDQQVFDDYRHDDDFH